MKCSLLEMLPGRQQKQDCKEQHRCCGHTCANSASVQAEELSEAGWQLVSTTCLLQGITTQPQHS